MNITSSSHALVLVKGVSLTQRRERTPGAPTTVVIQSIPRAAREVEQRVHEVSARYSDFIPVRPEAQRHPQIALYEFVQGGKSSVPKGTHLDVFA